MLSKLLGATLEVGAKGTSLNCDANSSTLRVLNTFTWKIKKIHSIWNNKNVIYAGDLQLKHGISILVSCIIVSKYKCSSTASNCPISSGHASTIAALSKWGTVRTTLTFQAKRLEKILLTGWMLRRFRCVFKFSFKRK